MSTHYQQEVLRLQAALYPHAHQRRQVLAARQLMEQHYTEPLDLAAIAAAACCSKFHFMRLFRRYYGRTPHQYLTALRLRQARQLLRGGAAVAEVCLAVGFESVTSFTGLFRRTYGCPPRALAARAR